MRNSIRFNVNADFTDKLVLWLETQLTGICLRGDGWSFTGDALAGFGQMQRIQSDQPADILTFSQDVDDYVFCHLNYDVKNAFETLSSENEDACDFPLFSCWVPQIVVLVKNGEAIFYYYPEYQSVGSIEYIFQEILSTTNETTAVGDLPVKSRMSRSEYLDEVTKLQDFIQQGDVYQGNFCQEFYWNNVTVSSGTLFNEGFAKFPNPFSAFYKTSSKAVMCFSPERFLSIENGTVASQPMKGTAPRSDDPVEDATYKNELRNSEKDRRENVMIVDMVRNDLSHYARKGSVKVPELYRIESYPKVHQMYSTVTAELKPGTPPLAALLKAFPMGSMTGAPKVRAMQILEDLEHTKRGVYSGTIGFISPDGKFDFNVVIRSLVYNKVKNYLSCHAGGGITAMSDPEAEFEESLLKAKPIIDLVDAHLSRKKAAMLPLEDGTSAD